MEGEGSVNRMESKVLDPVELNGNMTLDISHTKYARECFGMLEGMASY